MDYPSNLLPRTNFKTISWSDDLLPLYLIRHTSTKELFLPHTQQVDLDKIEIRSDHLKDLSTNLLGEFKVDDIYIHVTNHCFFQSWAEGETIETPLFGKDFQLSVERGCFYFQICDIIAIESIPITFEKLGETLNLKFHVIHTPTKCNFWHFSIRVLTEGKEIDKLDYNKKRKAQILRAMKFTLSNYILLEIGDFISLDKKHYLK